MVCLLVAIATACKLAVIHRGPRVVQSGHTADTVKLVTHEEKGTQVTTFRIRKPRCFLVYALAPEGASPAQANRQFNEFIADRRLPLVLFHDHFIGQPGGVAVFFTETTQEQDMLASSELLNGWRIEIRPLIFSYSPAAFDEQTAFTLRQYRGQDWEKLQQEKRPSYGNPAHEAETASEDDST